MSDLLQPTNDYFRFCPGEERIKISNAVCLGRTPRWGLGAYGAPGVQRILEIIQNELAQAMAYTGRPTLASLSRTIVRTDFP